MPVLMFHKDVYLPARAQKPCHTGLLQYSRHALRAGRERGVDLARLPKTLPLPDARVVEAELDDTTGEVHKQVWRFAYDPQWDLVMPVLFSGLVTTVWFNRSDDLHVTLCRERYVCDPSWEQKLAPRLYG